MLPPQDLPFLEFPDIHWICVRKEARQWPCVRIMRRKYAAHTQPDILWGHCRQGGRQWPCVRVMSREYAAQRQPDILWVHVRQDGRQWPCVRIMRRKYAAHRQPDILWRHFRQGARLWPDRLWTRKASWPIKQNPLIFEGCVKMMRIEYANKDNIPAAGLFFAPHAHRFKQESAGRMTTCTGCQLQSTSLGFSTSTGTGLTSTCSATYASPLWHSDSLWRDPSRIANNDQ